MQIDFNDLVYSLSYALDCVEFEVFGTKDHHARRVACMCAAMGTQLDMPQEQLEDLLACAVLHDNALTEYLAEELAQGRDVLADKSLLQLAPHCKSGEENLSHLPLEHTPKDVLLYHHEDVDGSGPFHLEGDEIPLFSQLIHTADILDANWARVEPTQKGIDDIWRYLDAMTGTMFSERSTQALTDFITLETWNRMMSSDELGRMLEEAVPTELRDYSNEQVREIATLFAQIVDYKSSFTMRHSIGIAQKAEMMARFYGYDDDAATAIYLAGALHDIGKMVISNDVLEKPDKLTDDEYVYMQNHAWYSYKILSGVKGFEGIVDWASLHHEKLDGSGYPFGKTAVDLDFNDRLLACIDIYQALVENRPYRDGLAHSEAISIEREMASDGKIDAGIVEDIDKVFAGAAQVG